MQMRASNATPLGRFSAGVPACFIQPNLSGG